MREIFKNSKHKHGFTLIELLVVISIIGILAGVVLFNFIAARAQARDVQRKNDLRQIQIALEAYKLNSSTGYPATITCEGSIATGGNTYLQKVPRDPSTTSCLGTPQYSYTPTLSGTTYTSYTLKACLENATDSDGAADATCTTSLKKYEVTSP